MKSPKHHEQRTHQIKNQKFDQISDHSNNQSSDQSSDQKSRAITQQVSFLDRPFEVDPIDYIRIEFEERKARRSEYSLRAFARDLNLSPSTMSEILSGKTGISPDRGKALAKKVKLKSPHDEHFCDLIAARYSRNVEFRKEAQARADSRSRSLGLSGLSLDKFNLIAEWYHTAILELIDLSPQYHSKKALSLALGVGPKAIGQALVRLVAVGELNISEPVWKTVSPVTHVGEQVPSSAIKKFHAQILKKAADALFTQDVSEREFQTSLFCIDRADLSELKKDLNKMRSDLIKKYGHRTTKNCVYSLSLQLFRISKIADK